jgi:hypothetical protein
MANELTIQYALPDPPTQAREKWRTDPPAWLANGKFQLVDETYNGLVYRGSSGGMFSSGKYTLSLQFDSDNRFGSRVTITGQAPPKVADAIRADAAAHGGGIDPRVGL